jgi:hypothetical protein
MLSDEIGGHAPISSSLLGEHLREAATFLDRMMGSNVEIRALGAVGF